jgi:hypothetical protein
MFVMHHPLEGKKELAIKCLDLLAMKKLYGTDPLFIFDPNDNSNAPDSQYHRNALAFWNIYPRFLRDVFTKAFTEGISDPQHGRVRESHWRAVMVRLRDSIIYCTHCVPPAPSSAAARTHRPELCDVESRHVALRASRRRRKEIRLHPADRGSDDTSG